MFWFHSFTGSVQFSSVQSLSRVRLFAAPWIAAHQASLSITNSRSSHKLTSITNSQSHSNSRPLSRWCHPVISSSVVPFSSCPQSLPASESFPMSQLFKWGGQSIGVSALASFLPKNTQGWSPLHLHGIYFSILLLSIYMCLEVRSGFLILPFPSGLQSFCWKISC